MDKKFFIIPVAACVCACLLTGCKPEENTPPSGNAESGWNKFTSALTYTSALETYDIRTEITENGNVTVGRLTLSKTSEGEYIAYKEEGASKSWFAEGISYTLDGESKTKQASSLNDFLNISDSAVEYSYSNAENILYYENENKLTFDMSLEGYEKVSVEATISGYFIGEITMSLASDANAKSIKYIYENIGSNPTVELPDVSEYVYKLPE